MKLPPYIAAHQSNRRPVPQALGIMARARPLGIVAALTLGTMASAGADAGPGPLQVEWQQQRLDVDADQVPFRELLTTVARRTGLELRGEALLSGTASVRFVKRTLRDGLEALLVPFDYAVVEEQPVGDGEQRVMVIIVGRRSDPGSETEAPSALSNVASDLDDGQLLGSDPYREVERLAEQGNLEAILEHATSGDPLTRTLSLQRLARHDPERARRIAIDAAGSHDTTERVLALQVLGGLDTVDAANALGAALADPDAAVRQAAVMGLMGQSSPVAARYLELAPKDDPEVERLLTPRFVARKEASGASSDRP